VKPILFIETHDNIVVVVFGTLTEAFEAPVAGRWSERFHFPELR
jgi:enoyl reductase-like protein